LVNCSPDIREQLAATPALWPNGAPRGSPISSVVLTNGDIDHIGGLLSLREGAALNIYATDEIIANIAANPAFGVLDRKLVSFRSIIPGEPFEPLDDLSMTAFRVPGKVPLYLEDGHSVATGRSGNTLGLHITERGGASLAYVPGCASIDAELLGDIDGCGGLLFDGTLWHDDEMIATATGSKSGRRMGHVPVSGPDGSMAALAGLTCGRRIFVHINNTNPLLVDGSRECQEALGQHWEISHDGMEIVL
jgi:pyrroloquinoline quinone biosynthesis protein B